MIRQPFISFKLRRVWPMLGAASILLFSLLAVFIAPNAVQAALTTIAPPATADFTAGGEGLGNNYGFSVASAGDINGDGYSDAIVGADVANKAYIYSGTMTGLSTPAFFTITGNQPGSRFGYSVGGGGDLDQNGADDVLVGAPSADVNVSNTEVGLVYVYTGTIGGLPTAAMTLTGEAPDDNYGWSIDIAGDVNDDGYDDVIVGAWQYGISDTGRVYIYHGGPTGVTNTVNLSLTGEAGVDGFGISVAKAGDVNGDGYGDVIVGAWQNDEGGLDAGKAYLYYGSESGITTTNVFTVIGSSDGEQLGTSVSGAGDVNGDGYADVIIGSDSFNAITPTVGQMQVYFGSATGLQPTPQLIVLGETDNDRYGFVVNGGGDVNGDGFDDVMVGAYLFDSTNLTNTGKAYLYAGCYGGVQASPIFTATGENNDDNFGHDLAILGDVNQDGLDDIMVGALGGKTPIGGFPLPTGRVYGYYGDEIGTCAASIAVTKTVGLSGFGPLCSTTQTRTVPVSSTVTYCYQVQNTGNLTLTHHLVTDSALGGSPLSLAYTLTPGMGYSYTITHTPSISLTSLLTWTGILSITAPNGEPTLPPGRTISATAVTSSTLSLSPAALDQDNDGIPDNEEGTEDNDNDGIPSYLDPDEFPAPDNRRFIPHVDG